MENSKLYTELRKILNEQGVTQQEISEHLEVENNHFWKTVKRGTVRHEMIDKVAEYLGLNIYLSNDEIDVLISESSEE